MDFSLVKMSFTMTYANKKKKKKEAQSQGTVTWWQRNAKFFGKKK